MSGIIPAMRLVTYRSPEGQARVGRLQGAAIRTLEAPSTLAWLAGKGRGETGEEQAADSVALLAPVPEPPSIRDFYAFEGHVAAGWRRRGGEIPEAWYEAPVFYFSNPASVHGPGEPVRRPEATRMLDFELEIAAVIGTDGEIAGFTLLNDWSARDVQRSEMTVGLGPAKGKDFALSLGPWLVTPDELPYDDGRLHVEAAVTVNGDELSRTSASEQHWSWPELVAHAARDTRLRPGDVIGSGTLNGGCLLELGPLEGGRWLEPGDVVAISAEGLGTLEAEIA
jgi:fumarylacetoacetate (FAA) hydrolase